MDKTCTLLPHYNTIHTVHLYTPISWYSSSLDVYISVKWKGYRVVSSTVDFCIDNVLDKGNCVINNTMNLGKSIITVEMMLLDNNI